MWVGGVADSQTRSKPLKKKNQINPKIAFFDQNFTFCFPKSHKNPGVGGWVNRFGKGLPRKTVFFLLLPLDQLDTKYLSSLINHLRYFLNCSPLKSLVMSSGGRFASYGILTRSNLLKVTTRVSPFSVVPSRWSLVKSISLQLLF